MENLVSIITPIYNAEKYLAESIQSVLAQQHVNWELLLINDGSEDHSKDIALSYQDDRIRYFEQENKGVSEARNIGLREMQGQYFCFLDADDQMPDTSIQLRLELFKANPSLSFVDGQVQKMTHDMSQIQEVWKPDFQGNPLEDLVSLTGRTFFGPSWMIKRDPLRDYKMRVGLTHGEDLLFYIDQALDDEQYHHVNSPVLRYRIHAQSAMSSIKGLEKGYREIGDVLESYKEINASLLARYLKKFRSILFKSYLANGKVLNALKVLLWR